MAAMPEGALNYITEMPETFVVENLKLLKR